MSLIIATWTGAIATVVLAVGAGLTVLYARKAFREQAREVGLLQKQAEREQEDRRREADARRRAQAALVYVVLDQLAERDQVDYVVGGGVMMPGAPAMVTATVHNTAERPIYDLRVRWLTGVPGVPNGSEHDFGTLGPRSEVVGGLDVQWPVELERIELTAFFRDAAGLSWALLPDGQLEQVLPVSAPAEGA